MSQAQITWETAYQIIADRVTDYVNEHSPHDVSVIYSAYETDDEITVDNLDEIAIEGKAIIVMEKNDFWGGYESCEYQSPVLESPTWLQLCAHYNDMMYATRDFYHCFFEGVEKTHKKPVDGVPAYRFVCGS